MPVVRFSRAARQDLRSITRFTRRRWGLLQADRYLSDVQRFCENLSVNSRLGRPCDSIKPGWRRLEFRRHVVFYLEDSQGLLIVRILHERMSTDIEFPSEP